MGDTPFCTGGVTPPLTQKDLAEVAESLQRQIDELRSQMAVMGQTRSPDGDAGRHGLCGDATCQPCMDQRRLLGQQLVARAEQRLLADLEAACAWAGVQNAQDAVVRAYLDWRQAGRPVPSTGSGQAPSEAGIEIEGLTVLPGD